MSALVRRLPRLGEVDGPRVLATASVAVVVLSYLSVLYFISNVAGDPTTFLWVVAASVVAATVLARVLHPGLAGVLALVLVAVGTSHYVGTLPPEVRVYGALGPLIADSVSLLSGLSILRIVNAGTWALAIAPAPTFLAWYLALRRHYVAGASVAGATLGMFVLTGNAGAPTTLLGAVGVVGALGFGDVATRAREARETAALQRTDGTTGPTVATTGSTAPEEGTAVDGTRRAILVELGAIVVATSLVDVVPGRVSGGRREPLGSFGGDTTVEGNLLGASDSVRIRGSISLSPTVRFTVESDRAGYWRVGSYDRYTGRGWVRTGGSQPYEGRLSSPPGRSRRVEQTVELEDRMGNMPALWKPIEIERSDTAADVLHDGSVRPVRPFAAGESYAVTSRVPETSPRQLRAAGTDYPRDVVTRYTRLPESTPARVARRTDRITANATTPYDTARVVERWLANNRDYSLDVEKPDGSVADAFLFEMDAGYCTYFATTMVAMLRTQDVPARFTVGYTPGERVSRDTRVVRGLDAHAWVEVYFPDHGWIRFDPTPASPRSAAEQRRLADARANNESNVDTFETGPEEWTPTPEPDDETPTTPDANRSTPNLGDRLSPVAGDDETPPGGPDGFTPSEPTATAEEDRGGVSLPSLPPREHLGLGLVVAVGAVSGLRQSGLANRAYREVWLRYQPRSDPVRDTRRAFERVEYVLARDDRPRRPGETVRQYTAAVGDERARRAAALYEQATYAGRATEAVADEAVGLADELVAERGLSPFSRRGNRGARSR